MHHTDTSNCHCFLHYTDLHVAGVQSGSKQKEMEKKKIIKKNSNIRLKQVEEGKRHTIQVNTCYEEDDTKIK